MPRPDRSRAALIDTAATLSPAVDRVVPWEDAPSARPAMTGKTVFTRG